MAVAMESMSKARATAHAGRLVQSVFSCAPSALPVLRKHVPVVPAFQVTLIALILSLCVERVGPAAAVIVAVSPASGGGVAPTVLNHHSHDTALAFLAARADEFEHLLGEHRAFRVGARAQPPHRPLVRVEVKDARGAGAHAGLVLEGAEGRRHHRAMEKGPVSIAVGVGD